MRGVRVHLKIEDENLSHGRGQSEKKKMKSADVSIIMDSEILTLTKSTLHPRILLFRDQVFLVTNHDERNMCCL